MHNILHIIYFKCAYISQSVKQVFYKIIFFSCLLVVTKLKKKRKKKFILYRVSVCVCVCSLFLQVTFLVFSIKNIQNIPKIWNYVTLQLFRQNYYFVKITTNLCESSLLDGGKIFFASLKSFTLRFACEN